MKIIIGLGNIGQEYQNTRHNAGFMVIEELAKKLGIEWKQTGTLHALIAKGQDLLLVKPTTLMNRSGLAAATILNYYKCGTENLIVIYDDIDLPLGTIRIRDKGSAGTHNGMKSMIQSLGKSDFKRVRIGIENRNNEANKPIDITDFVLSAFTEDEKPILSESIQKAVKELEKSISA